MQPFLKLVVNHIYLHYKDSVESLCIVLPSKRGAIFLREHFATVFNKTMWLPTIKSAEEFIEEISGLKQADEIDLLALLYNSYLQCYTAEPESFDKFSKWGHLMLQDFNEIDRYLIDSSQIYQNLKDIKEIENWSLGETPLTQTQENYLAFMASIGKIYYHFSHTLIEMGIGYQGLIYREASKVYQQSDIFNKHSKILFCGFNALNAAETKIYNWLYQTTKAEFLWDIDTYYYSNQIQEAGLFLRRNLQTFPQKEINFIDSYFKNQKTIQITSVAGQMGQAQLVHDQLIKWMAQDIPLSKVAVVLANEKLLWPVLKLLPKEVLFVNITMEYPLKYTQAYSFIELLLTIQLNYQKSKNASGGVYFKDFISVIQHSFFGVLLKSVGCTQSIHVWLEAINNNNVIYVSQKHIQKLFNELPAVFKDLFHPWESSQKGNAVLIKLIDSIRSYYIQLFQNNITHLEIEYLEVLMRAFNRINEVVNTYPYYNDVKAYKQLYMQTVGTTSVPFIGEPLKGLQIMGVLETRTLDFEYLIMVGVNEGVLPSGKTTNSFLPNDLKRVFNLPLYYEKDAIYAYHFYRLLQRAEHIHLIYDSETDDLGKGEKSRFISQLQYEFKKYNPNHEITENVALSASPEYEENSISILKNDITLKQIFERVKDSSEFGGISPSALITFKECSLKYYYRYGLGLKENKEVEESAEANTFGSILHLALENIYKPFINQVLKEADFKIMLGLINNTVESAFKTYFKDTEELVGKNYLQVEVLKVYVKKMLLQDLNLVQTLKIENKVLTILYLEKEWNTQLKVLINGIEETLIIKGKIDRIDKCGENIRLIDYKNSIKPDDNFSFTGFEDLFENTNYNKQFQLFTYAWLLFKNKPDYLTAIQPGIIPFKKFLPEPQIIFSPGKIKLPYNFNEAGMLAFESHLSTFISNIFNTSIPFKQTEDLDVCKFCGYNVICNK